MCLPSASKPPLTHGTSARSVSSSMRKATPVCRRLEEATNYQNWHFSAALTARSNVGSSNRPFRVKRFQTIHHYSVDVAHGLVLFFGIGTKALVWGFLSQAG